MNRLRNIFPPILCWHWLQIGFYAKQTASSFFLICITKLPLRVSLLFSNCFGLSCSFVLFCSSYSTTKSSLLLVFIELAFFFNCFLRFRLVRSWS